MANSRKNKGRLPSLFLLSTDPVSGIWFEGHSNDRANRQRKFILNGNGIEWYPDPPSEASLKVDSAKKIVSTICEYRERGNEAFLKLSGTTKTGVTWSLPAVGSCPQIDETCSGCYALDGFYRTNIAAQVGRVMRHEYLKRLIASGRIEDWVNWIVQELNKKKPAEPIPRHSPIDDKFELGQIEERKSVSYMRWHDSGDIFHETYGKAIFEVCRRTVSTAHWLPTRMSSLILKLARMGEEIPSNLAVQISCHRNGLLEQQHFKNIEEILTIFPESRIGLTYDYKGEENRTAPPDTIGKLFGDGAYICPATIAQNSKDRVCTGCRRCWSHTSVNAPVIYAIH